VPAMDPWRQIELHVSAEVGERMTRRRISIGDVQRVIYCAEETGEKLCRRSSERRVASLRLGSVTLWVEYSPRGDSFDVHAAYSHRMRPERARCEYIEPGKDAPADQTPCSIEDPSCWLCSSCALPLEDGPITLAYLDNSFCLDLPRCPKCGQYLITEELAVVRMAQVEQLFEDK
jgi:hypothetical protein